MKKILIKNKKEADLIYESLETQQKSLDLTIHIKQKNGWGTLEEIQKMQKESELIDELCDRIDDLE